MSHHELQAAPLFTVRHLEEAWQTVASNRGCAGVDGVTIDRFSRRLPERLADLESLLRMGLYRPLPLLKILVQKSPVSTKTRRLLVPAVRDRVLQTAAARMLSRSFEEEFLDSSFAYRPGRSVDRAVARIKQLRERGFIHVVDADIEGFFDHLDHDVLLDQLALQGHDEPLLQLLRQWIRCEYWDGQAVHKLTVGVAQGSPISPLLANLFLNPFDAELQKGEDHLVRYADDFVILCSTPERANLALARVEELLTGLRLRLNREKTRLTSFDRGFEFLGVYFHVGQIYIPWKEERAQGKVIFMARPMPSRRLASYARPPQTTAMSEAFSRTGRRTAAESPEPIPNPKRRGGLVAYLYVTEQGSIVRKSGDRILVESGDRILLDLPYHKLENILVFGNVQLTTQALAEALDKGIDISLFSRNGRYRGSLSPLRGKNVQIRLRQFELCSNPTSSLNWARRLIAAKITNGIAVLRNYAARSGRTDELSRQFERLEEACHVIEGVENHNSASGVEGAAAQVYFDSVMHFNKSPFEWPGRVKHPATDPINALLSLTYTLLTNEIQGVLEAHGLDPYFGFLHQIDYGRPSLALDVLEPFRHPVADRFVLTILNRHELTTADFQKVDGKPGVYLTEDGMKRYLLAYETWMQPPKKKSDSQSTNRGEIRNAVKHLASSLRDGADWKPYIWKTEEEAGCDTSSVTI